MPDTAIGSLCREATVENLSTMGSGFGLSGHWHPLVPLQLFYAKMVRLGKARILSRIPVAD